MEGKIMDRKLLEAKNAIFKMIAQFHHPTMLDNGELCIFNYCESALEAAFNVLGIEENYIKLIDFCKMWEDNDREYWALNSNKPFNGITADIHYKFFKEDYESWQKSLEFLDED